MGKRTVRVYFEFIYSVFIFQKREAFPWIASANQDRELSAAPLKILKNRYVFTASFNRFGLKDMELR
jgi:hypothetical protein